MYSESTPPGKVRYAEERPPEQKEMGQEEWA